MKRLVLIAAVTVGAALVLGVLLKRAPTDTAAVRTAAPAPPHRVEAELTAQGMQPAKVRVPKDHEVHLIISASADAREGLLAVVGYEDRIESVDIGPGLARELVFVSDRPGDDFAFRLGAEIVGRLEVTGSHLEAGHQ